MTLSSHAAYKHKPLPAGRHIRLLRVHASAASDSGLACDLDNVNLNDEPEYSALSYAWEDQSPQVPIQCATGSHQGILLITPNCAAALRQLRHENGKFAIWIDSICIDQASLEEKSSQVALMGDIYKAAKQVVVWLGERDDRVVSAIELLRKLSSRETDAATGMTPEAAQKLRAAFHSRARQLTKSMCLSSLFMAAIFSLLLLTVSGRCIQR